MSACSCINLLIVLGIFLNVTFIQCAQPVFTFWPDGVIPYSIDKGFNKDQVNHIIRQVHQINNKTCVRWKDIKECPAINRAVEFVHVTSGDCRYGKGDFDFKRNMFIHFINLTDQCFADNWVTHEMMHVMGFKHEQSRTDRNCYVTVDNDEVAGNHDYDIIIDYQWMEGYPYDIHSVMHFHRDSRMKIRGEGWFETTLLGRTDGMLSTLDGLKVMYRYCGSPHYCVLYPEKCATMDKFEQEGECL